MLLNTEKKKAGCYFDYHAYIKRHLDLSIQHEAFKNSDTETNTIYGIWWY
jgi:hypothetical protein